MKYSYKILEIHHIRGILVEYIPPVEFPSLLVKRVKLPYPISAATTREEIINRVEGAAPLEDWEETLDIEINGVPDFSDTLGVVAEVELETPMVPKSKVAKMAERVAADEKERGQNSPPVQIEV